MGLFGRKSPIELAEEEDDDYFASSRSRGSSAASEPEILPPIRLRDWEIPVAYVVSAFVLVVALLEITSNTGKGAPKSPDKIIPGIALVLAVTQAFSVRAKNRLFTGIVGIVAGMLVGYTKTGTSLNLLRELGLFVPFIYGFAVTQRQSRAQRALNPRGSRRRRGSAVAAPSPGVRGSKAAAVSGPQPNRRYTPPKAKVERTGRRR
jgi:hypothetical protein